MGGNVSRSVRRLPKTTTPVRPPGVSADAERVLAHETKSKAVEEDGMDPELRSNLHRLGPVKVDHHMRTVATSNASLKMFNSRRESENDASGNELPHNRLLAVQLTTVLDQLKGCRTREAAEAIATASGVDLAKLESVAKYINSPTVQRGSMRKVVSKGGEESVLLPAVWVQSRFL